MTSATERLRELQSMVSDAHHNGRMLGSIGGISQAIAGALDTIATLTAERDAAVKQVGAEKLRTALEFRHTLRLQARATAAEERVRVLEEANERLATLGHVVEQERDALAARIAPGL